ncbi:hypothetical protein HDZ31DRAFT_81854 [Schizophyllum fasciatum]
MTSFADLLQLANTQTQQAQSQVQAVLAERKRKEAEKRKQQEERERKERELEKQRVQRKLDEERRERERAKRREEEQAAKEAARRRREEEAREQVLTGLKRGPVAGKRARPLDEEDGGGGGAASSSRASSLVPLTREEKRERKMQAELRRAYGLPKSSKKGAGQGKYGARLPGGAMDVADGAGPPGMSTKQRLLANPIGLTKLYANKRDTRTTAEIIEARQQSHTLNGEDARHFDDWFGSGKEGKAGSSSRAAQLSGKKSTSSLPPLPSASKSAASSSKPRAGQQKAPAGSASRAPKPAKRQRSPAYSGYDSDSDDYRKPRKRRPTADDQDDASNYQQEIWKLFGKNRSDYVNRGVESDDDMEADAIALEREEKRSMRLARQEDIQAAEEERRHEEEKRRRKLMKDKEKRGKA